MIYIDPMFYVLGKGEWSVACKSSWVRKTKFLLAVVTTNTVQDTVVNTQNLYICLIL